MEMSNETKERLLTVFTEMENDMQEVHNLSNELDLDKVETGVDDVKDYADQAEDSARRARESAENAQEAIEDVNDTIRDIREAIKDVQIHANTVMDIVRPFLPKSDIEILQEFVLPHKSTLKGLYVDNYMGEGETNGVAAAIKTLSELLGAPIDLDQMQLSNEDIAKVVNEVLA